MGPPGGWVLDLGWVLGRLSALFSQSRSVAGGFREGLSALFSDLSSGPKTKSKGRAVLTPGLKSEPKCYTMLTPSTKTEPKD